MKIIPVIVISLLNGLFLSGCVTLNTPTARDKLKVANGELRAVLLQVNAEWIDPDSIWKEREPTISGILEGDKIEDTFEFLIGNFETGGYLSSHPVLYLSEDSKADGWIIFLLRGQTNFLALVNRGHGPLTLEDILEQQYVSGKESRNRAYYNYRPKWKLEIKESENLIYAGRLNLTVIKWDWGIFGTSYFYLDLPPFPEDAFDNPPQDIPSGILDKLKALFLESELNNSLGDDEIALSLLRSQFPDSGEPVVRLLEECEAETLKFNDPM